MRLFLLILLIFGTACKSPAKKWTWGEQSLKLKFAKTEDERTRGLQGHAPLGDNEGMLFLYEDEAPRSFWMKDVDFNIDLAFFDSAGRVLSIHQLLARDPTPVLSGFGVRFVLEMPSGWFARQGIKSGDIWERLAQNGRQ